jgi:hypothetical protein
MLDETYFDGIKQKSSKVIGNFKNEGLGNSRQFEGMEHFAEGKIKEILRTLYD